jgi:hypothetical protein
MGEKRWQRSLKRWALQHVIIDGTEYHFKSKQEYKWAQYLEVLRGLGAIEKWEYEFKTFWFNGIKRGVVSYTPDFWVWEDGVQVLHEVKVHLTQKDVTKYKRLAKYYPDEKLILVMNCGTKKAEKIRRRENALRFVEKIIYAQQIFSTSAVNVF